MKKIIMLLDNPFEGDPRVTKEIKTLTNSRFQISLYCLKKDGLPEKESNGSLEIYRIFDLRVFDVKKPEYATERANYILSEVKEEGSNVILHCHDHVMLHIGVHIKENFSGSKLIYDSHELFYSYPLMEKSPFRFPLLYLKSKVVRKIHLIREKRNVKYADLIITVNDSLTYLIRNRFKLSQSPVVLRNMPFRKEIKPDKNRFHEKFKIDSRRKIMIFITANLHPASNNLLWAMDAFKDNEDFALVIIGKTKGREQIEDHCRTTENKNVYLHDPILPEEIIDYLSCADFGILPFWQPGFLSYWFATPNKMFEYIMAGIPILSTPQPEFRKIVEDYKVGTTADPRIDNSIEKGLNDLIKNENEYLKNVKKAREELNWEQEEHILIDCYKALSN